MKLNWKKLFEMQAALDRHIIEDKDLDGQDLLDKKILALLVELGELANEWRGFKFWSKDQEPRTEIYHGPPEMPDVGTYKNPLLEEYVDCLHFILSIGNDLGIKEVDVAELGDYTKDEVTETLIELYTDVFFILNDLEGKRCEALIKHNYERLFARFIGLGELQLGFTLDQIMQAYLDKNEINHQRQNSNY